MPTMAAATVRKSAQLLALEIMAEPDEILVRQSTAIFSYATTAIAGTLALSSKVRLLIM
jgi:hypothetical protein